MEQQDQKREYNRIKQAEYRKRQRIKEYSTRINTYLPEEIGRDLRLICKVFSKSQKEVLCLAITALYNQHRQEIFQYLDKHYPI